MPITKYVLPNDLKNTNMPTLSLTGNWKSVHTLTGKELDEIIDALRYGYAHDGEYYTIKKLSLCQLGYPKKLMKSFLTKLCQIPTLVSLEFDMKCTHSRVINEELSCHLASVIPSSNVADLTVKCQDTKKVAMAFAEMVKNSRNLRKLNSSLSDDVYGFALTSASLSSSSPLALHLPDTLRPIGAIGVSSASINLLLGIQFSDSNGIVRPAQLETYLKHKVSSVRQPTGSHDEEKTSAITSSSSSSSSTAGYFAGANASRKSSISIANNSNAPSTVSSSTSMATNANSTQASQPDSEARKRVKFGPSH